MAAMAVSCVEKVAWRWNSTGNWLCLSLSLLLLLSTLVTAVEMERTKGGCLQITLQAGEYIKADPRCIVSRGAGLALHPPATTTVDDTGLLSGLKRRIRKAHGQQQDQQQQEKLRGNQLQRLSNTMVSNATDCFLAPAFPGDVALVSVSSSGRSDPEGDSSDDENLSATRLQSRTRPRSTSSSGQRSGRSRIDTDIDMDNHRSRRSSPARGSNQHKKRRKVEGARDYDPDEQPRTLKLVVLTQAIVAVGPEVTVKSMPSGAFSSPRPHHKQRQQRGVPVAATGGLSVCEGQGSVAVAGYGKLQTLRLRPGQKRVVESSRAVGWTTSVLCLARAAEQTPRTSSSTATTTSNTKVSPTPSAVTTFLGPGTVYVQTHSLSSLRRLLLSKPAGVSLRGHGADATSTLHGVGHRGRSASPPPRRGKGGVVGLSLKRGLAKRTKAGAKKVLLGLAFLALYAVVTALLLEGRDGLVKAPRHAVQVTRSLAKVARRVAMILVRLAREELWQNGEGDGGGGGAGAAIPGGNPVER